MTLTLALALVLTLILTLALTLTLTLTSPVTLILASHQHHSPTRGVFAARGARARRTNATGGYLGGGVQGRSSHVCAWRSPTWLRGCVETWP